MSSPYPILDNRPIDQLKVTELKEELKRRKLPTKGLKEELIRRLDEAMRQEQEASPPKAENGSDSAPGPEEERTGSADAENPKDDLDAGNMIDWKVGEKVSEVNAADIREPLDEGKFSMGEPVDGDIFTVVERDQIDQITDGKNSAPAVDDQIADVSVVHTSVTLTVNVESAIALGGEDLQNSETQNESGDLEKQLENHASNSSAVEAKVSSSYLENQVSEVSPVLGFPVKSDSVSTDVSIDEKTELKDNVIADDVKLELDVKPEMVQLSSSNVVPDDGKPHPMADDVKSELDVKPEMVQLVSSNVVSDDGKSHPMDFEEPHDEKVSIDEPGYKNDENGGIVKMDAGDNAEKLQLDRSPGDDSMEEDVSEGKIADPKLDSEKVIDGEKEAELHMGKEVDSVTAAVDATAAASKDTNVADSGATVQSVKRKVHDQGTAGGNNDTVKRQRKWHSEDLKIPENKRGDGAPASTTPKDFFQPSFRRSFSRSDSMAKEEAPKERVVPESSKAATNSLKIENFVRPFTLKAVQELLSKTGTVTNFWMDAIKTHCFVSFSSVEEAIETRNAVYNLQWPPNGGRLLVAEFVDPEEVKVRVEAPPQSPLTPVTPTGSTPASVAPSSGQPQPSSRHQVQKKQLQPPPSLLPPPPLSNPPPLREQQTAREQNTLPPPPPLPEKVDPPIVTLDDLFKKTKATPRIYYLSLSEEQVAAKLKAQGKSIKQ